MRGAVPTSRTPRYFAALLWVPILTLLVVVTGFAWWNQIESDKKLINETIATAEFRARQVDDTLAEAITMLFDGIDLALVDLIDDYTINGPSRFDQHVKLMFDHFPEGSLLLISVVGADGYVKFTTQDGAPRTYGGDREHFKVHQNQTGNHLFISRPIVGRITKQWSIQFSRPIYTKGKFEGVMVMSLSPYYLYDKLLKIPASYNDSAWIARSSGEFLARNMEMDRSIGFIPDEKRPYDTSKPGDGGSFSTISQFDGVERLYQWRHLTDYPIIVAVGISKADLLAPIEQTIERDKLKLLIGTVALWGISILGVFLTLRLDAQLMKRREAEYEATHDELTGLANRNALTDFLPPLIKPAPGKDDQFAILFIDIDGFKAINDTYGHAVGDEVLVVAAKRIAGCARGEDLAVRLGGDEFVLVCQGVKDTGDIEELTSRIYNAFTFPIVVDDRKLDVKISIGCSQFPQHGSSSEKLLAAADRAMYEVKSRHKATAQ